VAGYLEAFWMQWLFLGVVIAAVLWGSLIFPATSTNATFAIMVTLALLLLAPQLSRIAIDQSEPVRSAIYAFYFLIPHVEWFDLKDYALAGTGAGGAFFCLLSTLYAACYAGFFLIGTWLSFRRRTLTT